MKASPFVAIACGGTGGHLFPGLAIGESLIEAGCDVMLLISRKEVDQQASSRATGMAVECLPAVAMERFGFASFLRGFIDSYLQSLRLFAERRPVAVLGMGGFTGAPPVLAGKRAGAVACLHEGNSVPGRANRWLAPFVDEAFVFFESAVPRLLQSEVTVTGMPVRPVFRGLDQAACRMALGLDPSRPVLLITGGSQGARAINGLLIESLGSLVSRHPRLQFCHLTGTQEYEATRGKYRGCTAKTVVRPFLSEMELALGAASAVVSRAGASSLAEIAALRVPSLLIPYPSAADDHQRFNAEEFGHSGAALVLNQAGATADRFTGCVSRLLEDEGLRESMQRALSAWDHPDAAARIADRLVGRAAKGRSTEPDSLGGKSRRVGSGHAHTGQARFARGHG